MKAVYRAADALVTSHSIDTRSVREAMACGCPVARMYGTTLNGFRANFNFAIGSDRAIVRRHAKERFDPTHTAKQFKEVLDRV